MSETLLVIGGASLDTLHLRGRTVRSAGGGGLYTSLAAHRAGARVTMVGPRPDPVPPELAVAVERLDWRGPVVPPERLPSFEIAHLGEGKTELCGASWRAEADLSVESLPSDLPAGFVYCIGLTDPRRQLELVRHFKSLGFAVSCGTFPGAVAEAPEVVLEAFDEADVFFCNQSEALGLFGSLDRARTVPGKLLFITRGAEGARVVQGDHVTDVPAITVDEVDPTGAGDTFCGTVLALLASGAQPVEAARQAVVAAGEMVTEVGPAALLRPPDLLRATASPRLEATNGRVRLDHDRIDQIAKILRSEPEAEPFPFVGDAFPPPGHPAALDFFFTATMQQFGFWTADDGRYLKPTIVQLGGEMLKGSDYLWTAYRRWLGEDPAGLTPEGQSRLDAAALAQRLRSDDGDCLPSMELRWSLARAYGRDLTHLGWSPAGLVAEANADPRPVRALLTRLDHVAGYKEDPLRKKSVLLALILRQRPEGFLRREPAEAVPPVVDYHVQRGCLRMGLVRVDDEELHRRLSNRELIGEEDERTVRQACYEAMSAVQRSSGRSMGAVDWFFFQNRRRCPEMSDPDCRRCPVDPACAHEKDLFQPVRRTTFY